MKNTVVSHLRNEKDELVGIKVKTYDDEFTIPVLDVRRSEGERRVVNNMIKQTNRSKYLQPSFGSGGGSYQVSRKKR